MSELAKLSFGTQEMEYWQGRLDATAEKYGFDKGYKLCYQPLSWIPRCTHAFISLNPGARRSFFPAEVVHDPAGNSYVEELETSKSPINKQFIMLYELLGTSIDRVLTTVVHPYRSSRWSDLSKAQKDGGEALGREWLTACLHDGIRTITTTGREAERVIVTLLGARLETSLPSGWGAVKLNRYVCADGRQIIAIPHLSTFKLLSRPESVAALLKAYR